MMHSGATPCQSETTTQNSVGTAALLDALPHSVALLDEQGSIVRVNRAWREVDSVDGPSSGQPGANYLSVCDNVEGDAAPDARAVASGIRSILRGETQRFRHEYSCVIRSRGTHWFSCEATSLGTAGTERVMLWHFDVTDPLVAQRAVDERANVLRVLLSAIDDVGIYMLDPTGRVRTWNAGARRLTGWTSQEVIGQPHDMFYPPEEVAAGTPETSLRNARLHGGFSVESRRLRRDGSVFVAACSVYPVVSREGELTGFAKVVRDITQQHQAEAERQQLMGTLEQRNHEMERFVYTVSHDLKTPLVTVSGFIGHALADLAAGKTERLPQFLDRVAAASSRMRGTIDDLLGLSRIGRTDGPHVPTCLERVVRDAVEGMREHAARAGATINLQDSLPAVVADPSRVREVVENLLDNALKYGCPRPGMSVEVGARRSASMVELFVRDHGPGIPEQARERVFGLFNRLHVDQDGTGIGLAIVRRIAEVHGGRAWVEPALEGGAAFFVSFPYASPADVTQSPAQQEGST